MRRAFASVVLAFLAGLSIGYFARGVTQRKDAYGSDWAGIEKLHQEDIRATLSQDPRGLIDIWTEDAVRFSAGKPPVVGKRAIGADDEKGLAPYPGFKVLSYVPKYKNTQIEKDLAFEWFEADATFKLSPESPPNSLHAEGLRVMRRQSDGSWKFAVLILNQ